MFRKINDKANEVLVAIMTKTADVKATLKSKKGAEMIQFAIIIAIVAVLAIAILYLTNTADRQIRTVEDQLLDAGIWTRVGG